MLSLIKCVAGWESTTFQFGCRIKLWVLKFVKYTDVARTLHTKVHNLKLIERRHVKCCITKKRAIIACKFFLKLKIQMMAMTAAVLQPVRVDKVNCVIFGNSRSPLTSSLGVTISTPLLHKRQALCVSPHELVTCLLC